MFPQTTPLTSPLTNPLTTKTDNHSPSTSENGNKAQTSRLHEILKSVATSCKSLLSKVTPCCMRATSSLTDLNTAGSVGASGDPVPSPRSSQSEIDFQERAGALKDSK